MWTLRSREGQRLVHHQTPRKWESHCSNLTFCLHIGNTGQSWRVPRTRSPGVCTLTPFLCTYFNKIKLQVWTRKPCEEFRVEKQGGLWCRCFPVGPQCFPPLSSRSVSSPVSFRALAAAHTEVFKRQAMAIRCMGGTSWDAGACCGRGGHSEVWPFQSKQESEPKLPQRA